MAFTNVDKQIIESAIAEVDRLYQVALSLDSAAKSFVEMIGSDDKYANKELEKQIREFIAEVNLQAVGPVGKGCLPRDDSDFFQLNYLGDKAIDACVESLMEPRRIDAGMHSEFAKVIAYIQFIRSNYLFLNRVHGVMSMMKNSMDQVKTSIGQDMLVLIAEKVQNKSVHMQTVTQKLIGVLEAGIKSSDMTIKKEKQAESAKEDKFNEVNKRLEQLETMTKSTEKQKPSNFWSSFIWGMKDKKTGKVLKEGRFDVIDKELRGHKKWATIKPELEAILQKADEELTQRDNDIRAKVDARAMLVAEIRKGWQGYIELSRYMASTGYTDVKLRSLQYHESCVGYRKNDDGSELLATDNIISQMDNVWAGGGDFATGGMMKNMLEHLNQATPRKKQSLIETIMDGVEKRAYLKDIVTKLVNMTMILGSVLALTCLLSGAVWYLNYAIPSIVEMPAMILAVSTILSLLLTVCAWNIDRNNCKNFNRKLSAIVLKGGTVRSTTSASVNRYRAVMSTRRQAVQSDQEVSIENAASARVSGRYEGVPLDSQA